MSGMLSEFRGRYKLVELCKEQLHRYQRKAVRFLLSRPFSALFLDVGMGKCVIILTLISVLIRRGKFNGPCLVVAPLRVARATWPAEIRLWKQSAGLSYQLIRAEDSDPDIDAIWREKYKKRYAAERRVGESPKIAQRAASRYAAPFRLAAKERKRRAQTRNLKADIHIINIEALEWLVSYWEHRGRTTGKTWPYKMVVLDESSKFKDHTTKRFKALKKCLSRIERLHELTASPATEGYEQLFAQIFLLDRGKRLGRMIGSYRKKYFTKIDLGQSGHSKYVLKKGADKKIGEKIADICLVMKQEDHRDELGDLEWKPIMRRIELDPVLMDKIDDFQRSFILKLDDLRIEALNSAALFNKLLQATSGAVYDEEKNVVPVHDEKIEALRELKEELQGEPLLVPYWFQSSLARLKKAFPGAVAMDKEGKAVERWNAGEIDMLFMQAAGTAHGLNMQKGPGHDLCYFDLPWSAELYEQMIGRLARQGQKQLVRAHHLMCVGTVDEYVYKCLQDKQEGQRRLFDFIRAERARLDMKLAA